MSFMQKIFGTSAPSVQNPQPQQGNANNPVQNAPLQQTQQTPQTAPNGVIPEGGGEKSPVEKFATLWEPVKVDPNDPSNQTPAPITPEKMAEAAGKIDFTKVLDQQTLSAVVAGGDGAVQALAASLNKVAQTVFGQSAYAATRITEQAVQQAEEKFAARLPSLINQQSSRDRLIQENKAFNDPAVKPVFDMVHAQLTTKYPTHTSEQIIELTKDYMKNAGKVFNPVDTNASSGSSTSGTNRAKEEDWSTYS